MTGRIFLTGAAGRLGATDVVVNCAAFNDVDGAEDRPTEALAVNAFAVRSLARAAEATDATFVHFSTDFDFDGTGDQPYGEHDQASPRSTYAATKLLGEWFALDSPRGYVLRVESLFGAPRGWRGRQGSVDAIIDGLERGDEVKAFTDRVVSPSYVHDVVGAIDHLVGTGAPPGVYHCVSSGMTTWYELAEESARLLGVPPRVRGITMDMFALKASRPRFCALDNRKLAATGFPMPAWSESLRHWLTAREASHGKMDQPHG